MKINRHKRHKPSLCVTCADQYSRHKRHTPLGGVTTVTLVNRTSTYSLHRGVNEMFYLYASHRTLFKQTTTLISLLFELIYGLRHKREFILTGLNIRSHQFGEQRSLIRKLLK